MIEIHLTKHYFKASHMTEWRTWGQSQFTCVLLVHCSVYLDPHQLLYHRISYAERQFKPAPLTSSYWLHNGSYKSALTSYPDSKETIIRPTCSMGWWRLGGPPLVCQIVATSRQTHGHMSAEREPNKSELVQISKKLDTAWDDRLT